MVRMVGLLLAAVATALLVVLVRALPRVHARGHVEPEEALWLLFFIGAAALTSVFWTLLALCHPRSPLWLSVTLFMLSMPVLLLGAALVIVVLLSPSDFMLVIPALACLITALIAFRRELPRFQAAGTPGS